MARTLTRGGIIRGGNPSSGRAQPVLAGKFVNPGELAFVVGDERIAEGNGLSGDEQVVAADRLAGPFETGAEQATGLIGGCVEGKISRVPSTASICAVSRGDPFLAAP